MPGIDAVLLASLVSGFILPEIWSSNCKLLAGKFPLLGLKRDLENISYFLILTGLKPVEAKITEGQICKYAFVKTCVTIQKRTWND